MENGWPTRGLQLHDYFLAALAKSCRGLAGLWRSAIAIPGMVATMVHRGRVECGERQRDRTLRAHTFCTCTFCSVQCPASSNQSLHASHLPHRPASRSAVSVSVAAAVAVKPHIILFSRSLELIAQVLFILVFWSFPSPPAARHRTPDAAAKARPDPYISPAAAAPAPSSL